MMNRKYYSFERNNYYYGKLLTSKDFQNEQDYINNKRRLINRVLHGVGIVYGLDVVAADDSSIILQSGMALDAAGREIVVPRTQVLKLSTIEGYSSLKTDTICLGIAYEEKGTEPVYAVMDTEEDGRKYNSTKEQYRLYLQDRKDCIRDTKTEDRYLTSEVLYQDQDIQVIQYLPAFISPQTVLKGRTEIRKISHTPSVFSFSCKVTADRMKPEQTVIRAENVSLEYGKKVILEQSFRPEDYIFSGEELLLDFQDIQVVGTGSEESAEAQSMKVAPVQDSVLEHVRKTSYQGTLDVDLDRTYDEKLFIAEIHLIRSDHHSMIDEVGRPPFDQYVSSAEQLMILEQLHEYLVPESSCQGQLPVSEVRIQEQGSYHSEKERRVNSSGVFEMSLGNGGEMGKVYFSDEIMHGLGNGPVCVEIGVEYISRDTISSSDRESIILGDGSIFASDSTVTDEKVFELDQAIKILPERGTFIVGVRPRSKMGKIGLRIRWYAYKPEDLEQRVYSQKDQKGCIMIQPDTMVLSPKSSVHINPVFINMPEETLTYTLLDPEGGKIDNNGVYTAPAQEGVYEIKVEALAHPEIFTHAFMIVSQKKTEE